MTAQVQPPKIPSLAGWVTAVIAIVGAAFLVAWGFFELMPDQLKEVETVVKRGESGDLLGGVSVAARGAAGIFVFLVLVMLFSVGNFYKSSNRQILDYLRDLPG